MNNLFDKGIIKPNPETQKELKKDLSAVEMNPIKMEKDKSNPKRTHHSDGFDYLCDILIPFKPPAKTAHQGLRL